MIRMTVVRLVRSVGGAALLALALGTSASLAAPPRQTMAPDTPSSDEPATLPLCSDLGQPQRPSASSAAGPATGEGVREAPSAGLSAEEQAVAAQGASTGGFTTENGPETQSGIGPVACADSPAAS
jgi:hypothetical protein